MLVKPASRTKSRDELIPTGGVTLETIFLVTNEF